VSEPFLFRRRCEGFGRPTLVLKRVFVPVDATAFLGHIRLERRVIGRQPHNRTKSICLWAQFPLFIEAASIARKK